MKKLLFSLFSFVFFLSLSAEEPRSDSSILQVKQLNIIYHDIKDSPSINKNTLKKRLKTKVGSKFQQDAFDNDLKKISKEFLRIDPSIRYTPKGVLITLNIWPKPIVKAIIFEGNAKISTSRLKKKLSYSPGDTFDKQKFYEAFNELKTLYLKKGFFEAQLTFKVKDLSEGEVDVIIHIEEGRSGYVRKIVFEGSVSKKEKKDIIDLMVTKEHTFFLSWLNNEGLFNEETLEQDAFLILSYFQNNGYADAQISINIKDIKNKPRVDFIIQVNKGPLYSFDNLTFSGNTILEEERMEKLLPQDPLSAYSPEVLRNISLALSDAYGRRGYLDTIVDYSTKFNIEERKVNVNFDIKEGKQYKIGLIKIFGNHTTKNPTILHECLLIPGSVFNTYKLKSTEDRLNNIGYFESVNVYPVSPDVSSPLGPNYRDIHIEVEEKGTGFIGFFGGYSTSASINGGIRLVERNFNYKGLSEIFSEGIQAIRGDGEHVELKGQLGKKMNVFSLSWTKPYIMDTPWSFGFDIQNNSNKEYANDYQIQSYKFGMFAQYVINPFLRFSTHYRLRNSDTKLLSNNVPDALIEAAKNDGCTSAIGASLIYDSTNHSLEPSIGFRSTLSSEFAGLGGDFNFINLGYENSYYHPFLDKGVIKLRADTRFIKPIASTQYTNLPLDERLFLGGETSIRGYASHALGPHFINGDPSGGISMGIVSAEYNYQLFKLLSTFVFCDAGSLTDKEFSYDTLKSTYGLGLRLKILGQVPITIGWGFPIADAPSSDLKKFFVTFGFNF